MFPSQACGGTVQTRVVDASTLTQPLGLRGSRERGDRFVGMVQSRTARALTVKLFHGRDAVQTVLRETQVPARC